MGVLFRRKPADDAALDFHPEMVPPLPPIKVCKRCKEAISKRQVRLQFLIAQTDKYGVTDEVANDFIRSIAMDHDDVTLMALTGFIAVVAKGKFGHPIRSATKLIMSIMQGAEYTLGKVLESISGEAPGGDCQWHNMGPLDEEMGDQGDEYGPVPPNGDGPSMFG